MSVPSIQLLVNALVAPASLHGLGMAEWDLLIRQARNSDLLARVAAGCLAEGLGERIPPQPKMHLESAATLVMRQERELRWEVAQIRDALASTGVPIVLLKGSAYVMAGLAAARGRMMSDVDILVPRDSLAAVESALMMKGWVSAAQSAYDQRYYRTWMHELPPMRHFKRGTIIDVHHAILPMSGRLHPSSEKLLLAAKPIGGNAGVKALAPVDMVLHSATHLFHEGDLERGMRGLVDVDGLLRELGRQDGFWQALVPRAIELELLRPLFYALRYTALMLATPVPEATMSEVRGSPGAPRFGPVVSFMDALFLRALRPNHASTSDIWTPLARWLLYLRGHWLRMPPRLLLIHLVRKTLTRKPRDAARAA